MRQKQPHPNEIELARMEGIWTTFVHQANRCEIATQAVSQVFWTLLDAVRQANLEILPLRTIQQKSAAMAQLARRYKALHEEIEAEVANLAASDDPRRPRKPL